MASTVPCSYPIQGGPMLDLKRMQIPPNPGAAAEQLSSPWKKVSASSQPQHVILVSQASRTVASF